MRRHSTLLHLEGEPAAHWWAAWAELDPRVPPAELHGQWLQDLSRGANRQYGRRPPPAAARSLLWRCAYPVQPVQEEET